jgi:hypothetical protein
MCIDVLAFNGQSVKTAITAMSKAAVGQLLGYSWKFVLDHQTVVILVFITAHWMLFLRQVTNG